MRLKLFVGAVVVGAGRILELHVEVVELRKNVLLLSRVLLGVAGAEVELREVREVVFLLLLLLDLRPDHGLFLGFHCLALVSGVIVRVVLRELLKSRHKVKFIPCLLFWLVLRLGLVCVGLALQAVLLLVLVLLMLRVLVLRVRMRAGRALLVFVLIIAVPLVLHLFFLAVLLALVIAGCDVG